MGQSQLAIQEVLLKIKIIKNIKNLKTHYNLFPPKAFVRRGRN